MALLTPQVLNDSVRFGAQECRELGQRLHASYANAEPYPHIVLDDFLPHDLLRRVNAEFPTRREGKFANAQSNLKTGYQLEMIESLFITNLLSAMNSAPFLGLLESLTGIEGLIPDPYYDGGGLHETARGGHLSVHADFNLHQRYTLLRRINLILFLNEGWKEDYGGHLELWTRDMKKRSKTVLPTMARAVVFNTDESSFHGHPDPLNSPDGTYRRSIALYYFTVPDDPVSIRKHTTRFVKRAGSSDRSDVRTRTRELATDLCPPALLRALRKIKNR